MSIEKHQGRIQRLATHIVKIDINAIRRRGGDRLSDRLVLVVDEVGEARGKLGRVDAACARPGRLQRLQLADELGLRRLDAVEPRVEPER